ncbi:hypothetical protein AO501_25085 [Mycobacterium gordonae]|uniref:Uncharacterized protein n=1 Tax=Mycobacterium gordonae TaxID=1778 RepID=A0A0Q2X274_MYCGO|nr:MULTISPECIES: hypothetical protein [Mycobacterium]KQH75556.1 hypothetical protein AO501_25085 [Mycobacterium gordonae]MDP7732131.1 hypothetical protein [Mycobacterium sp. TY813]
MSTSVNKWRVTKRRGRWMVRRPDGGHLGAFYTWHEAIAQVRSRLVKSPAASAGAYFDRRGEWDHDAAVWHQAFGFVGPVRCETTGGAE